MSNTILRQVVSGDDAKQQLLHGINKSCDIIGSTIGYRGQNVFLKLLRAT
jgi:chaperonin GroEL (HSP60 family)